MSTRSILRPTTSSTGTNVRRRRRLGGRLYHGETAIDFYGQRWWGLALLGGCSSSSRSCR